MVLLHVGDSDLFFLALSSSLHLSLALSFSRSLSHALFLTLSCLRPLFLSLLHPIFSGLSCVRKRAAEPAWWVDSIGAQGLQPHCDGAQWKLLLQSQGGLEANIG